MEITALLTGTITITVLAVITHAWRRQPLIEVMQFGAHVQSWQISAGLNAMFWFQAGASIDRMTASELPMGAVSLAAVSICADAAKVVLPLSRDYNLIKMLTVLVCRVASIFATAVFIVMVTTQGRTDAETNALVQQGSEAAIKAAQLRVEINAPTADLEASRQTLQAQIDEHTRTIDKALSIPALNLAGHVAYKNGHKMTVADATQNCDPVSVFMRRAENRTACERSQSARNERTILQNRLDNLSSDQATAVDAADALSSTIQSAIDQRKNQTAPLQIHAVIEFALNAAGFSAAAANPMMAPNIFGVFAALLLEMLVAGTINAPKRKNAQNSATFWAKAAVYFSGLFSRQKQNKIGTNQTLDLDILPKTLVEQFRDMKKPQLNQFFDMTRVATHTGIHITDDIKDCLVIMAHEYGRKVSIGTFYTEKLSDKGIPKITINYANQIMAAHGYRYPERFGSKESYEWVLPEVLDRNIKAFVAKGFPALDFKLPPEDVTRTMPQLKLLGGK